MEGRKVISPARGERWRRERERIASSSLHPLFVATSMHHCHFHYTDVTFLHTNNMAMGFPNPLYRVE